MKREVIGQCPICGDTLEVTEVSCDSCDSTLRGHFKLCKFCQLSKEHKEFAETFIKNRGNIKEIERDLGISYPTVKGKLDGLIEALGYINQPPVINDNRRREILESLDKGEIAFDEAMNLLKE